MVSFVFWKNHFDVQKRIGTSETPREARRYVKWPQSQLLRCDMMVAQDSHMWRWKNMGGLCVFWSCTLWIRLWELESYGRTAKPSQHRALTPEGKENSITERGGSNSPGGLVLVIVKAGAIANAQKKPVQREGLQAQECKWYLQEGRNNLRRGKADFKDSGFYQE